MPEGRLKFSHWHGCSWGRAVAAMGEGGGCRGADPRDARLATEEGCGAAAASTTVLPRNAAVAPLAWISAVWRSTRIAWIGRTSGSPLRLGIRRARGVRGDDTRLIHHLPPDGRRWSALRRQLVRVAAL